jgi:glutamine amidotransferase
VESLIPDALYPSRIGTTDSEAVFLAMMGAGLENDPLKAAETILQKISTWVNEDGHREKLRFTSALTDGHDLFAFRFAENDTANSLYYREEGGEVVVVSEPLDHTETWVEVPANHVLVAEKGRSVEIRPIFNAASHQSERERAKPMRVIARH